MKYIMEALAASSLLFAVGVSMAAPPAGFNNNIAAAFSPSEPSPIEAATGKGKHTGEERFSQRLAICDVAVRSGVGPPALIPWMKEKGFTKEASERTIEVCTAYGTGIALGVQLAQRQLPTT